MVRYLLLFILMGLLFVQVQLYAQVNTGGNSTDTDLRIDFTLVYSSLQLSLDTWDDENEPDLVKIEAYKRASGYLAGIPFHYEHNRSRMTIIEEAGKIANELEFTGYHSEPPGYYQFDYTLWIPSSVYEQARRGSTVQGHGTSELEDPVAAQKEARLNALQSAARNAIRTEYTENNKPIPGLVDGRIMWHDVIIDEIDPDSGYYVYDITAWIKISES